MLPERWTRTDEWYDYRASPRGDVRVLAALDETTYEGGAMGEDHPIAWCHEFDGGRAWYTGGGHTRASWAEPLFLEHVGAGILWAAGVTDPDAPRR
jgi:type 1 glutamine amidotransferase